MLQATSALEDPGALKSEEQAANAAHILAQAALKYNQLENVTGGGSCALAALWCCFCIAVVVKLVYTASQGWTRHQKVVMQPCRMLVAFD